MNGISSMKNTSQFGFDSQMDLGFCIALVIWSNLCRLPFKGVHKLGTLSTLTVYMTSSLSYKGHTIKPCKVSTTDEVVP